MLLLQLKKLNLWQCSVADKYIVYKRTCSKQDLWGIHPRRPRTSLLRRNKLRRPLRKDVFGTDAIGTPGLSGDTSAANAGITVQFYDGSANRTDGIIIKQRGANTFVVARIGTPGTTYVCKLVNTTPNAAGEMYMTGYVGGNGVDNQVPVAKITRRLAYGFPTSPVLSGGFNRGEDDNTSTNHDATRYTWYLDNDSSADILVLTAI